MKFCKNHSIKQDFNDQKTNVLRDIERPLKLITRTIIIIYSNEKDKGDTGRYGKKN